MISKSNFQGSLEGHPFEIHPQTVDKSGMEPLNESKAFFFSLGAFSIEEPPLMKYFIKQTSVFHLQTVDKSAMTVISKIYLLPWGLQV